MTVKSLYRWELIPILYSVQAGKAGGDSRLTTIFQAGAANGLVDSARSWVRAVASLTLRQDLHMLTALPWGRVVSHHPSLLRKSPAWCPACYATWQHEGRVIYQPLLWMFSSVTACPTHRRPLEQICPSCNRKPHILALNSMPGRCSRCRNWLGLAKGQMEALSSAPCYEGISLQLQAAAETAEWVSIAQRLNSMPSKEDASRVVSYCIDTITGGNAGAFSRLVNVNTVSVSKWKNGACVPSLDSWLKISSSLKVSLARLLSGDKFFEDSRWRGNHLNELLEKSLAPTLRRRQLISEGLKGALKEDPPPTLYAVATRLGYKYTPALRKAEPELCNEVVLRYRSQKVIKSDLFVRKVSFAEVTRALDLALRQDCPPTLSDVAIELGYSGCNVLLEQHPDLCQRIRAKRAEYRKRKLASAKSAVKSALSKNPPTPLTEVARQLDVSTDLLYRLYPDLCKKLAARRIEWRANRDYHIENKLREAIMEKSPPSLSNFARRHGYKRDRLRNLFPKLCQTLHRRYEAHQRRRTKEKRKRLEGQVEAIVLQLLKEEEYPSFKRVLSLFVAAPPTSWVMLREVLQKVKRRLRVLNVEGHA